MPMRNDKALRPYAWEKAAFLEDANEDSLITGATFRILQKICAAYNRKAGYAECARTFIVDRVPVSTKTVQRAKRLLIEQGRIFIAREHIGRASTRYGVNWYFRGADTIRENNGGKPVFDCRNNIVEGTSASTLEGTFMSPDIDMNVPLTVRRGDMMSPKPINKPQGGFINTSAPHAHGLTASAACAGENVKVVAADLINSDGDTILAIHIEAEDGEHDILQIIVESANSQKQEDGQKQLNRLSIVTGITINEPSDLLGARFCLESDGGFKEAEP